MAIKKKDPAEVKEVKKATPKAEEVAAEKVKPAPIIDVINPEGMCFTVKAGGTFQGLSYSDALLFVEAVAGKANAAGKPVKISIEVAGAVKETTEEE